VQGLLNAKQELACEGFAIQIMQLQPSQFLVECKCTVPNKPAKVNSTSTVAFQRFYGMVVQATRKVATIV